jgi:hypothetical protein
MMASVSGAWFFCSYFFSLPIAFLLRKKEMSVEKEIERIDLNGSCVHLHLSVSACSPQHISLADFSDSPSTSDERAIPIKVLSQSSKSDFGY